ncbi:MAG: hypothetical protein ACFB0B_13130 [Thermonemataceae bacterium]
MYIKKIIYLISLGLFVACQPQTYEEKNPSDSVERALVDSTEQPFLISCEGVGKLSLEANLKEIKRTFGEKYVTTQENRITRQMQTLVTDTSGHIRFIINWREAQVGEVIDFVEIRDSTHAYTFENGIQVGATLQEISKRNGTPIPFFGFGWDYGGTIAVKEMNGKILTDCPCFGGVLGREVFKQTLLGDQLFYSDDPSVQAEKIVLKKILLYHRTTAE